LLSLFITGDIGGKIAGHYLELLTKASEMLCNLVTGTSARDHCWHSLPRV